METVLQAAQLRAQGKHAEALALVDATLPTLAEQERFMLMLQGLYAAEEAAEPAKARAFAQELAAMEPNLVSIQPYVALAPEDIVSLDFKR
jgi:thioesterase domain-containing protein